MDPFNESKELWANSTPPSWTGSAWTPVLHCRHADAPALRTLRAHNLTGPEDVAVVGFDDERAAFLVSPQLTTMRHPNSEMGRFAVEFLLRKIQGEEV